MYLLTAFCCAFDAGMGFTPLSLALLYRFNSRSTFTFSFMDSLLSTVIECEDSATAAKVVELLTEQKIEYNAKTDTVIQVKKEDMNSAQWALASQGIPTI